MRLLTTTVTVAALVAHAFLGCCWHHAHAEVTGGGTSAATITPVIHGNHVHFHANSQDGDESTPPDHHHDRQGCDEGACIFVAANRASDVNYSSAMHCQWGHALFACFVPAGAEPLLGRLVEHRRPTDLAARHCALYLSLRTLRI